MRLCLGHLLLLVSIASCGADSTNDTPDSTSSTSPGTSTPAAEPTAEADAPEARPSASESGDPAEAVSEIEGEPNATEVTTEASAPTATEPDTTTASEPPASPAADPFDGWKTFETGDGGTLRYPPDWRVQNTPGGLLFQPPDADPMAELIAGMAAPANGVTDPLSSQARTALDGQVRGAFPFLRRKGRGRAVETGVGKGAAYDYAGKAPTSQEVRVRVFAVIADGTVGGITLMADPERFERRAPIVERIFESIARSEAPTAKADATANENPDIDPRILGRFRGETIATEGVYVNTQLLYAFNASGTVLYGAQSAMSASERDEAGNLEWTASGTTDASMETGTFTAKNGTLTIRWDDGGRSVFAYGLEPDGSLVLRNPTTKKLINFFPRVR